MLGAIYLVFFIVSVFIIGIFTGGFRDNLILYFIFGTILFTVIGSIIGIIPSIVAGMITSLAISITLWIMKKWLSAFLSIAIGLAICYGFAILVDYAVWSRITDRATTMGMAYYSWRGLPTFIYILTGGFMSWKLFKVLTSKNDEVQFSQSTDSENKVEEPQ